MTALEFKQRFMPHYRLLYRVAYHLTGNQQDAEDLLQDTYLKLWTKRDKLSAEASTDAYLITLMRNLYRDQRRLKYSQPTESLETVSSIQYETFETSGNPEEERREELHSLINRLPDKQRQVMQAHIMHDRTYEEIEQNTGLSNGNIRVIISRAKQTIIKLWKKKTSIS